MQSTFGKQKTKLSKATISLKYRGRWDLGKPPRLNLLICSVPPIFVHIFLASCQMQTQHSSWGLTSVEHARIICFIISFMTSLQVFSKTTLFRSSVPLLYHYLIFILLSTISSGFPLLYNRQFLCLFLCIWVLTSYALIFQIYYVKLSWQLWTMIPIC